MSEWTEENDIDKLQAQYEEIDKKRSKLLQMIIEAGTDKKEVKNLCECRNKLFEKQTSILERIGKITGLGTDDE